MSNTHPKRKPAIHSIRVFPEDSECNLDVMREAQLHAQVMRDMGYSARIHERDVKCDGTVTICRVVIARHK